MTAADLLQPKGDISLDWFPTMSAEDVNTLLSNYIVDGVAHLAPNLSSGEADIATRAWAMARAARNVYMRLSNTPASFTVQGEGGQTITGEQVRSFKIMAEKYEAEFSAFAPDEAGPAEAPSGSVATKYLW